MTFVSLETYRCFQVFPSSFHVILLEAEFQEKLSREKKIFFKI